MAEAIIEGDLDLANLALARVGRRHRRFVVASVSARRVASAAVGLPLDASVEIGSVSKGLTGLLYAHARSRGEVGADTRLADLLPLDGTPAGCATLGELAVHRSGLPRLAKGSGAVRGSLALVTVGSNPYGRSLEHLLEATRHTPVGSKRPRYSNLGFMLLGHALASAAGSTYAALLAQRLAVPLSMTGTSAPAHTDDLTEAAVTGCNRRGRPRAAWTGEDIGPAGGVRSTADDLARLLAAMLDGTAPGADALDAVSDFQGSRLRIGAAWLTLDRGGRPLTWHNGGTGGFRSFVAMDRAAGVGIALVSARCVSVDGPGMRLIRDVVDGAAGAGR